MTKENSAAGETLKHMWHIWQVKQREKCFSLSVHSSQENELFSVKT